jgi:O-antigen ligase
MLTHYAGNIIKTAGMAFAATWVLLFFWHYVDFNGRVFRIPLLLLSVPLMLTAFRRNAPVARLPALLPVFCLIALGLAAFVAAWNSPFPPSRSFSHFVFGWLVLALAGFTMKLLYPDNALRLMFLGMAAGLAATSVWAVAGSHLGFVDVEQVLHHGRLLLFTGFAGTLGLMSGFLLTGFFFFMRHGRCVISRKIDLILMLLIFAVLIFSQTRTGLLAFAASAGLILVLADKHPLRALVLVSLCGLMLAGAAYGLGQLDPLKRSVPYQRMLALISHPLKDPSITGRLAIWEAAAGTFATYPLTGCGLRMFPPAYAEYMDKQGETVRAKYAFVEPSGGHAHNLALGVLTELGVLGFFPLLLIYIYALKPRKAPPDGDIRCMQALFFYFVIHGLAEYMLTITIYGDLFFGLVGLFMGAVYCEQIGKNEGLSSDMY